MFMSLKKIFRQEVLNLAPYHLDEHPGVKLNQNESPWDLPVELKARVVENLLKTPWNRYPLGDLVLLKKKMAKHLNLMPDNLVFANGSNVLISALVLATSVGKRIAIPDPTFSLYEIEATLHGAKTIRVPLEDDFSLSADKWIHVIKKENPTLVFIPNPNAPTGTLFDGPVLRKIIETATGLVVIDEAYFPFSKFTVVDWIQEFDNLVVLRTFSKAYALGGLRLGWAICEPEAASQIEKCLLPFCVSRLTLATALTILDHAKYVDTNVQKICTERDRVFGELNQISGITTYPSNANFILFQVEDSNHLFKKLIDCGVIVRKVDDGRRLTHVLRVSIGTKEENDAFLKALKKCV